MLEGMILYLTQAWHSIQNNLQYNYEMHWKWQFRKFSIGKKSHEHFILYSPWSSRQDAPNTHVIFKCIIRGEKIYKAPPDSNYSLVINYYHNLKHATTFSAFSYLHPVELLSKFTPCQNFLSSNNWALLNSVNG